MIIYIDIDDTICNSVPDGDYSKATPKYDNIAKANKLYDDGNTIIYWTARGSKTKIDWSGVTEKQFKEWNVKYTSLKFEKPVYDLFIDDKALNVKDW